MALFSQRLVIGLPHLASEPGGESILKGRKGLLSELALRSRVFRLAPSAPSSSPEAAWLGLNPEDWSFEQGPLTAAWLKLAPPERSLCLHVSMAQLKGGQIGLPGSLGDEEMREAVGALRRLDSKRLIFVEGRGADHALVWTDASPDLQVVPFHESLGRDWIEARPAGDEEELLIQWVEDAHDLLQRLEFNERRSGEGLEEVNLAWPWGRGRPAEGFNLPLRRGFVTRHLTQSIRLGGLASLFGERTIWSDGLSSPSLSSKEPAVTVFPQAARARVCGDLDSMDRLLSLVEEKLLRPVLEGNPALLRLTLLAPNDPFEFIKGPASDGIGLNFDTERSPSQTSLPFDERIIEEQEGKRFALHEAVNLAVSGGNPQA